MYQRYFDTSRVPPPPLGTHDIILTHQLAYWGVTFCPLNRFRFACWFLNCMACLSQTKTDQVSLPRNAARFDYWYYWFSNGMACRRTDILLKSAFWQSVKNHKTERVPSSQTSLYRLLWREYYVHRTLFTGCSSAGVPNLGDARGLKVVFTWVHLYQWGTQTQKGWEPLLQWVRKSGQVPSLLIPLNRSPLAKKNTVRLFLEQSPKWRGVQLGCTQLWLSWWRTGSTWICLKTIKFWI